ncbi:uncharacterized protein ACOB8E_001098 [Sarcophilus harrisii]
MKFFPVMLLACMACTSSVFAHLNESNDAEERRAVVSRSSSSDNPSRSSENIISAERAGSPSREVSPQGNSREDGRLSEKVSISESPEKESMRKIHRNKDIIERQETANEQSATANKNSQRASADTTEGRLAKLGLKFGEDLDQMLANIRNKIKNYFSLRS